MKKKTGTKKKSFLKKQGLIASMLGVIGLSLGAIVIADQMDLNNYSLDNRPMAQQIGGGGVEVNGSVWRENPVNTHTITLSQAVTSLTGRVKEGHPEAGCTNNPDPGVSPLCDQNQFTESFDLVCDGEIIYSYRDRGRNIEEWFDVVHPINLRAGRHNCEVRHAANGTGSMDGGSVDYELVFGSERTDLVCKTITFSVVPNETNLQEGMTISDQFWNEYGIRFSNGSLSNVGQPCNIPHPILAQYGRPQVGYQGRDRLSLTRADKAKFEPFFLAGRHLGTNRTNPFRKEACSLNVELKPSEQYIGIQADIMDLDNNESYRVQTVNAQGQVIDEVNVNKRFRRQTGQRPANGHQRPTRFSLGATDPDANPDSDFQTISSLIIQPTRKKGPGWGYGFDNFTVCAAR